MKTACSLFTFFALALSSFAAGWDTNVWGNADTNGITSGGGLHRYYLDASTNKVFVKEVLSSNAFAAIEERAGIVGVSAATTNAWFRNNRADLVNIKAWIAANADEFVQTSSIAAIGAGTESATNDDFVLWHHCSYGGKGGTNIYDNLVVTNFVAYSTANLIVDLNLPTNYFTSTPWRKLTDPTTSNGWHSVDDILNQLVHIESTPTWSNKGETNSLYSSSDTTAGSPPLAWADAISQDATNETLSISTASPRLFSEGWIWYWSEESADCRYFVSEHTVYSYPVLTLSTNLEAETDVYATFVHPGDFLSPGRGLSSEYDNNSVSGISSNLSYSIAQSFTNISGIYTSSVAVGDTALNDPNITDIPTAPASKIPYTNSLFRGDAVFFSVEIYKYKGWCVDRVRAISDYASINLTNGFVYTSN